jgi:hypothetical protein
MEFFGKDKPLKYTNVFNQDLEERAQHATLFKIRMDAITICMVCFLWVILIKMKIE